MKERFVTVATPGGSMEAFVTHPEGKGPFPAVVIYMDVWGLREEFFDIARRVATVGYYCIVPDLYYRQGRIRVEFRNDKGQMLSLEEVSPEIQEKIREPMRALTNAQVVEDTGAILKFIENEPVRAGAMGSIGYCMGGRFALCVAGHYPDRFKASVSLHGTRLIGDQPDSPHLLIDKFQGELYCGFAETDPYMPLPAIEQLANLLKNRTVQYRYEVHKGTIHGYALAERDIFHRQAAARDWEMIFAMFHRQLPAYGA